MRIVQVHNQELIKGGAEIYLHQINQLLNKKNHFSQIIYINDNDDVFELKLDAHFECQSLNQVLEKLNTFLQNVDADYIFLHNNFNIEIENYLAENYSVIKFAHSPVLVCPGKDKYWRKSNVPCTKPMGIHCFYHIYSEQCSNRHPKRIFESYRYAQNAVRLSKSKYKGIVLMSEWHKELLLEMGIPASQILLNPYYTEVINKQNKSMEYKQKRLFFAGRLTPGKGLDELMSSVIPILKKYDNVYLDIVGDGLLMDTLKQKVIHHSVSDKVLFHGWKDRKEVKEIMSNAYLLVFPSTYPETFGIVGIEAQMFSLPAVAFDVGGVSTWLKHNQNGLISRLGDIDSIKYNIELLLNDKELYQTFSLNAYKSVNNNFTEEIHYKKLLNFLNSK